MGPCTARMAFCDIDAPAVGGADIDFHVGAPQQAGRFLTANICVLGEKQSP